VNPGEWSEILDPEMAARLVLMAAGATAGLAILLGLPVLPAAVVGGVLALVGIVAYGVSLIVWWVRHRRSRP
jgi:hypothetical protein